MSPVIRAAVPAILALLLSVSAQGQENPERAAAKLADSLSTEPDSARVLGELLQLHDERPEEFDLWSLYLAERLTDGKGKLGKIKGLSSARLRRLKPVLDIARLRAEAVGKLAGLAKRLKGAGAASRARYLFSLGRALTENVPALSSQYMGTFTVAVERCRPKPEAVLGKLTRAMERAMADGRHADAIKAAAILRGVVIQFRRTKTDLPGLAGFEKSALRTLDQVRRKQAEDRKPLTLKDLLAIPKHFRPGWEAEHADWSVPTVIDSPYGRYRIESTCGVRTTLFAAADIEFHHARLVRWFGKDPFLTKPGLVRICRTPADFEGQGQPHYWAGGFQGGDLTCLVANATDRRGLAGLLTHELTHRFDGVIYPGMPTWLVEGRAVFTQAGTLWARSEAVEPRAANTGNLYSAAVKGYGRPDKLKELIEGTIEEYRDNYPVGYSLWIYLTRLRKDLFGHRVEPFMRSFSSKPKWKAMERFAHFFVDGREKRPAIFEEFAKDFSTFLWEAVSLDAFPWKTLWWGDARVAQKEAREAQGKVARAAGRLELESPYDREDLDHSNWPAIRGRSEDPAPGERHAFAAGMWLEGQGLLDAAADAFAWARDVDELTEAQLLRISALHEKRGDPVRAWLCALAGSRCSLEPAEVKPLPEGLSTTLRSVTLLLDGLESLQAKAVEGKHPRVARALMADRVRLARAAGLPAEVTPDTSPAGEDRPPPDCGPYIGILADGVVEERWAPADTVVSGNWVFDPPDLLVLGSREPFKAISGNVRDAGVRRVFVRGREWFEGTYSVQTKVRLVSAHVGAAVVVGHSRHDRGLVVNIRGGDFAYATGRSEEDRGFRGITVHLDDLRAYDGGVGRMSRYVPFETPRTSFLLSIRVSGSFVQVRIDDRRVLSHRTTTGVPVAGRVGFHLGSGLLAFENPAVRRHRAVGPFATCPCEHGDEPVDLTRVCEVPWETWPGRRLVGIPRDPLGTVLLVFAGEYADAWLDGDAAARTLDSWGRVLREGGFEKRLRVAHRPSEGAELDLPWGGLLPEEALMTYAGLPALEKAIARQFDIDLKRVPAERRAEFLENRKADAPHQPPWLAIDPRGVIRDRYTSIGNAFFAANLIRRLRGW